MTYSSRYSFVACNARYAQYSLALSNISVSVPLLQVCLDCARSLWPRIKDIKRCKILHWHQHKAPQSSFSTGGPAYLGPPILSFYFVICTSKMGNFHAKQHQNQPNLLILIERAWKVFFNEWCTVLQSKNLENHSGSTVPRQPGWELKLRLFNDF